MMLSYHLPLLTMTKNACLGLKEVNGKKERREPKSREGASGGNGVRWSREQQLLLERRSSLRRSLDREGEEQESFQVEPGDSADSVYHDRWIDESSEITTLETAELEQIEEALQRIRDGVYHLCASCEKRIPKERRVTQLKATRCITCQQDRESSGRYDEGATNTSWDKVYEGERSDRTPQLFDDSQRAMAVEERALAH